jgi:protease-4
MSDPLAPQDPLHPIPASPGSGSRGGRNPLWMILGLSGIFFLVFVVVATAVFFKAQSSGGGSLAALSKNTIWAPGGIGVIDLKGVIMDSKRFRNDFKDLEEDDQVRGILVRLDSPGGSVAPSQEIYQVIKSSKKPVYASMGSVAASGAFYAAMGAKKIYANPGTITGSIGVIMEFANLEKLYEWAKVKRYVIKTGAFKDSGSEYREMRADERALLQGMVDQVLGQFKQAIIDGRGMDAQVLDPLADGRIFSGEQAKAYGFVDDLGTFSDAVHALAEHVGIKNKDGSVPLIYPEHPKQRLLDLLLEDPSEAEGRSVVDRLIARLGDVLTQSLGLPKASVEPLPPGIYWIWQGAR